jgi:hypothetical protein
MSKKRKRHKTAPKPIKSLPASHTLTTRKRWGIGTVLGIVGAVPILGIVSIALWWPSNRPSLDLQIASPVIIQPYITPVSISAKNTGELSAFSVDTFFYFNYIHTPGKVDLDGGAAFTGRATNEIQPQQHIDVPVPGVKIDQQSSADFEIVLRYRAWHSPLHSYACARFVNEKDTQGEDRWFSKDTGDCKALWKCLWPRHLTIFHIVDTLRKVGLLKDPS